MAVFKTLNSQDVIISPLKVSKNFLFEGASALTASDVGIDRFLGINGNFLTTQSLTGQVSQEYQVTVYNSAKQLYYTNYLSGSFGEISNAIVPSFNPDGTITPPSGSSQTYNTLYDNFEITTLNPQKIFPTESIGIISIPTKLYGDYIEPNSFRLVSPVSGTLFDDGEGRIFSPNLYNVNEYVGNIIYEHGIVVITKKKANIAPSPTPSPSLTPSPTPTLTPTRSPSVTPSITPSISISPTPSPTPSPSITPSVTPTISISNTPSISITPSVTPSLSISSTPSVTPSLSISSTPSATPSLSVSNTPSPSITPSVTPSLSISGTPGVSVTPTSTSTPSVTPSLSISSTPSVTPSITSTPSITPSLSISSTPSVTPSLSISSTPSVTPSLSISSTPSVTPSLSISSTPSVTPSLSISSTPSVTPSLSISSTPSVTPSLSISSTPSVTPSLSISSTPSVTPSISISSTPSITPSVTPSATQFSILTLCTDNGSGWGSDTAACNGGCTPVTVYVNQTGITSFSQASSLGLPLYINTNFIPANLYNGGNNWFKSTSGEVFQVGADGAISTFGICPSVTPTPTRTPSSTPSSTPAPSPTPSISVSSTPASTPSVTPSITPSTSLPIICYEYEYINGANTVSLNGTLCAGGSYSVDVYPSGEGTTFCIQELSQNTINAYAALGLTLTPAATPCT